MARTDFRTPRLYVSQDLAEGAEVKLDPQQTNYLVNVLRLGAGAPVLLFNGRDGEFSASLATSSRKAALLAVGPRTRAQEAPPDVDYLFAPLKHARLDYMAQKAVEMGARRLRPVITRHTQVARVNLERLQANAIEACEQCGVIWIPEIAPVEPLAEALKRWPPERLLVFCDEEAEQASPARRTRNRARRRRRRPPDRAGRRLRRRRARRDPLSAAGAAPEPRTADFARGHGCGRGAGAYPGDARRLAKKTRTLVYIITGRFRHFTAMMWLHPDGNDSQLHGASRRVARIVGALERMLVGGHCGKSCRIRQSPGAPSCRTLNPRCAGPIARDQTRIRRRLSEPDARGSAAISLQARVSGPTSGSAAGTTRSRRSVSRQSPATRLPASRSSARP